MLGFVFRFAGSQISLDLRILLFADAEEQLDDSVDNAEDGGCHHADEQQAVLDALGQLNAFGVADRTQSEADDCRADRAAAVSVKPFRE